MKSLAQILFGLTLALTTTAFANGPTGAEIFAEKISEPGFELTVGGNSCNLKIFHRELIDENGNVVGSQVEGRVWVRGDYVQTVQSPRSIKIKGDNKVVLRWNLLGKIVIETDDNGNPVRLSGRELGLDKLECNINQ